MGEINLKRNIMISGGFRAVIMFTILLTSWLSTRYLGVGLKGQMAYLTTIAGFIWLVVDLGIHKTYPYLLRKNPDKSNSIFAWSWLLFAAQVLILAVLGYCWLPFWSKMLGYQFDYTTLWLLIGLISINQIFHHLQMFNLGLDRVLHNNLVHFAYQLLLLICVGTAFIWLKDINRLRYILIVSNLAMLTGVVGYSYSYLRSAPRQRLDLAFVARSYGMGFRVFLSSLLITLLLRADLVILKRLLGFESVGTYSLAAHLVDMMQMASNVVGSLLLVKLSDTSDEISRWILMKRIFILFMGVLGLANLAFVVVGKPLIVMIYGADFAGSYLAYLWLIPASFGLSLGSLFNTYLWSKGFPLISVILPGVALLTNIMLNFLLIPVMGVAGAGLASSISYSIWFLSIVFYEQRLSGGRMLQYMRPKRDDFVELLQMLQNQVRMIFKPRR